MAQDIDWGDASARARLAAQLGPDGYNEAFLAHQAAAVVATVNGYPIRPVQTRFGRLFGVGGTRQAFATQAAAEDHARTLAPAAPQPER